MRTLAQQHVEIEATLGPGPTQDTWTVRFEAPSLQGVLASLAGTLTMAGFDIVSATIVARSDGTVLDSFDVVPLEGTVPRSETAPQLAERAAATLTGRYDLAGAIARLRERFVRRSDVESRIEVSVDSELTTGIKVTCADRPGLLYDLASTLSRHSLRCRAISVLTIGGRAVDTFRVIDARGVPPRDTTLLDRLRADLLLVCE
jgi:[protein-PII] uridylyltransferase